MASLTDWLCAEHSRLMPHVDGLRVIADEAAGMTRDALTDRLRAEHAFLSAELSPHMTAVQEILYPSFERLMQNRHSMTPMTRDHGRIRGLLETLEQLAQASGAPRVLAGSPWLLDVRRALYQLYALLKVHLAEEEMYAPILEHDLAETQLAALLDALDARQATEA